MMRMWCVRAPVLASGCAQCCDRSSRDARINHRCSDGEVPGGPAPQPGAAQSVLFLTATSASRRPANRRDIAESHAQQLPPARSVMTRVQNEARLVIEPRPRGGAPPLGFPGKV